jgi:hypothetical protein
METTVLEKQGTGQQSEVLKFGMCKVGVDAEFREIGNDLVKNLVAFSGDTLSLILYK